MKKFSTISEIPYLQLCRYVDTKKRVNYMGDVSQGPANDYRFYSHRRVPYFGGSDSYQYVFKFLEHLDGTRLYTKPIYSKY